MAFQPHFASFPARRPAAGRILVTGAALWCGAILAAPILDLDFVYGFFATICHQDPGRSWSVAGAPLAACVRCVSIYAGFLAALAARVPANGPFLRAALAATLLEFLLARGGFDHEAARAATGLALGMAAAGFIDRGVGELFGSRLARVPTGAGR